MEAEEMWKMRQIKERTENTNNVGKDKRAKERRKMK